MPRPTKPTGRKSASVSLYPRDLAAVQAIRDSISDPDGPPVSDSDAIRDAIHRHPAVTAPVLTALTAKTRTRKGQ